MNRSTHYTMADYNRADPTTRERVIAPAIKREWDEYQALRLAQYSSRKHRKEVA